MFSTVLETHDHGSFNSWGRDRYWRPDHLTASQAAVDANPELPFLDAIYTTVIRDSRWRCEHGWDIDLDDGSTNYEIYNNLMLCGGLKLREGFSRKAYNNIVVDNGLSSHVWFSNSNDEVTRNVMARANGAYVLEGADVSGCSDSNFYYEANEDNLKNLQEKFNWDFKSVVGENPFVDRDNGDFSIKPGSKAFDIGFKNFPMDQFGVKKPSLKAIAKTPSFQPKAGKKKAKKATPAQKQEIKGIYTWVGAQLKGLEGEEFSAYGVSKKDGGVVLSGMSKDSLGLSAGFQNNDLVQKINGTSVKTPAQLIAAVAALNGQPASASVVRNQAPCLLYTSPSPRDA